MENDFYHKLISLQSNQIEDEKMILQIQIKNHLQ
jgi:hypothetical protein